MIDSAVGVDMTGEMGGTWTFDVPSGERKRITMDARLEPARQHGSKATTSVLIDGVTAVRPGADLQLANL